MTIQHALAGGIENYLTSVERWSRAVLSDLRAKTDYLGKSTPKPS